MTCVTDSCRQGRDKCPTPHACRDQPPRWAPYMGGLIVAVGAVAAYVYLIWPTGF